MLKRILLALFVTCMINQSGFAQGPDLFLTFGQGVDVSNTTDTVSTSELSGTAFLYSRNGFDFDALDILVDSSDLSILQLTGGSIFNSAIGDFGSTRFSNPDPLASAGTSLPIAFEPERQTFEPFLPIDADGNPTLDGNGVPILDDDGQPLVAVPTDTLNVFAAGRFLSGIGVRSSFSAADGDFDVDADAFLIAEIQYNIVGEGTASLDLSFGPTGLILLPDDFDPADSNAAIFDESDLNFLGFGSATLTVESSVPEPSSAALLVLGLTGMFARRRR